MRLNPIWVYILGLWTKWTARWCKAKPTIPAEIAVEIEPHVAEQEVPALQEFEVAEIEAAVIISPTPIDLDFIEPIVAPAPPTDLQRRMDQFLVMMLARELRAHKHYLTTGSCNIDVPSQDCRVVKPVDSRAVRPRNSRAVR
jgi:hypothetical protein